MNNDDQLSLTEKWCLFSFGVLFIILPLIGNLIQLHNEIQVWISDVYSKHTIQAWIGSYLRVLYMITILFGSAFAAIDICNSNLFHLSIFNMGLNKRQRAIFKNQRILSTVLFENIPQLILQLIYLIITIESNISPITIMAMIFSTISIVSSIFDYKLSSLLIECESITVIEMDVESKQLRNASIQQFRRIVIHHRNVVQQEMAKIIGVDWRLIEILIPIQTRKGCKLTLYIRNNDSTDEEKNLSSSVVNIIKNEIESASLAQVLYTLFCVVYTFY